MARQTPILIKSFVADAALTANSVVVASGVNDGNVMLPAAAGAVGFVGVAQETVLATAPNFSVSVQIAGIARMRSSGGAVIATGDYVEVADATGAVQTQAPGFGGVGAVQGLVGIALSNAPATAGALVDVLIQPMLHRPV